MKPLILVALVLAAGPAWADGADIPGSNDLVCHTPSCGSSSGTLPIPNMMITCIESPNLCGQLEFAPSPTDRARTGDPDIDRGMAICDAHKRFSNYCVDSGGSGPDQCVTPYDYPPDYAKSCAAVEAAWQASDTARWQRAAAAKTADDLAWLKARWGRQNPEKKP